MQKYYFTYITKNLTNNKKYIGQHCTRNMNDGYFGSNKKLKEDIDNGDEYRVEIIEHFDNIFDLANAEQLLFNEYQVHINNEYYNLQSFTTPNFNFEHGIKKETKKKISKTLTGRKLKPCSEETKRKIGNSNRGKKMSIENIERQRKLTGSKAPMWGKHHSEETKRKISIGNKGSKNPMYGKNAPNRNKPHSEETKQKMKDAWIRRKNKS